MELRSPGKQNLDQMNSGNERLLSGIIGIFSAKLNEAVLYKHVIFEKKIRCLRQILSIRL